LVISDYKRLSRYLWRVVLTTTINGVTMSDLIHQLTLGAGLNSEKKVLNYLEVSRSTWFRRLRSGKLKRVEWEALRHRAGYLLHDKFRDYRIVDDRIYSRNAGFATACEIENMDLIRQFLAWSYDQADEKARRQSGIQLPMFGS